MKKQKVLIVHNYYQIPGGEDTVVENEKKLLEENGHEVVLYTRHNDEIKSRNIFDKLMLPFETVFSFKTYKEIKKKIVKESIDIVHVHNTVPLISPSVYYAAKFCKVPVVQTIHNFRLLCPNGTFTRDNKICEDCIENGLKCSIKNKCYRNSTVQSFLLASSLAIHRFIGTYKKIDGYIALTEFNKNKLKEIISEEKIYVKPNFIKRKEYKKNNKESYYLFLGRIDELKGINLLVQTWKEVDNCKLFIAGKGPLEDKIEADINKNNIKNIDLLGFKNRNEVMELIMGAKALIVPSQWYEGFPMTIVEAFSVGVPVIASDIGNLSTIIKDRENGLLFKYNDEYSLKEKILELNTNKELLKKISDGAKDSFDKNYNENINYEILINIYKNCSRRN